jgi:hypothetical protein
MLTYSSMNVHTKRGPVSPILRNANVTPTRNWFEVQWRRFIQDRFIWLFKNNGASSERAFAQLCKECKKNLRYFAFQNWKFSDFITWINGFRIRQGRQNNQKEIFSCLYINLTLPSNWEKQVEFVWNLATLFFKRVANEWLFKEKSGQQVRYAYACLAHYVRVTRTRAVRVLSQLSVGLTRSQPRNRTSSTTGSYTDKYSFLFSLSYLFISTACICCSSYKIEVSQQNRSD